MTKNINKKEDEWDVFLRNKNRKIDPVILSPSAPPILGAMVGVSSDKTDLDNEKEKAEKAVELGVDTLVDMSTNPTSYLLDFLLTLNVAVGIVPIYKIFRQLDSRWTTSVKQLLLQTVEDAARKGVDFIILHSSLNQALLSQWDTEERTIPMSSRGGALMRDYMKQTGRENFYLEYLDELLEICAEYHVAISLAGGLRSASIVDALDTCQLAEIEVQKKILKKANAKKVKVHVELINHSPLSLLPAYKKIQSHFPQNTTFGALGPSPTDIAVGYDDVAGAIGAAVAIQNGISWITCTTAKEHYALPTLDDLVQAIRYFQVAIHIGSLPSQANFFKDQTLSRARASNNWDKMAKHSIFPKEANKLLRDNSNVEGKGCSICNELCPLVSTKANRG